MVYSAATRTSPLSAVAACIVHGDLLPANSTPRASHEGAIAFLKERAPHRTPKLLFLVKNDSLPRQARDIRNEYSSNERRFTRDASLYHWLH
jgi:hypothetical protein